MTVARKIYEILTPAERGAVVLLLGLMLIGMVFEMLGVGIVIPIIMLLTQPDYVERIPALAPLLATFENPSHEAMVIGATIGLVTVYLLKALFLAFLAWRQTRFAFGVQAQVSQRLFTVYLRQPYTFHLQRNSAQLLRNVIGEANMFAIGAINSGMLLVTEALVLLGLCSLLLIVEPLGTMIVVGMLGFASWMFYRASRGRLLRWGTARQHHEGLRIQHLQQGFGGAKDVKLLGRETEFLDQYRLHNVQSARASQLQATLQQLPRLWLELFAVCGLATLVLTMLFQGRALEAVLPTLGLFAAAAFRLMPSVSRVLGSIQSLHYGLSVIDILNTELNLSAPVADNDETIAAPFRDSLELDDVTFTYSGGSVPAVQGLSLTIHHGESVGFIGASGSGKSTLVDILLGLLAPDVGKVLLDGEDIQKNLRNWQDQIGYVPQSIFLSDDTLRRNVAFGLPNDQIDEAAVWRTIDAAQLGEFVKSLPQGLDTRVGERGVRLSGGQRQRIGIARALYHDPEVLVLDEATSSLDTDTEHGITEAVNALHGSKTIIIVAHRLTTVERCDRLYRLEQGRIVGEGVPSKMPQAN